MADTYDVIIIGSGAGGGTLAHRLAPSGKRVLILERGDWLPREAENWDAQAVFVDNRYVSEDRWYDKDGKAFQPQVHYFVGGATKFYGAALYRLRERDFDEVKDHGGISPAWPVGYAGNTRRGRPQRFACGGVEGAGLGVRNEHVTESPIADVGNTPVVERRTLNSVSVLNQVQTVLAQDRIWVDGPVVGTGVRGGAVT